MTVAAEGTVLPRDGQFLADVAMEVTAARARFGVQSQADLILAATEELGEVAKAELDGEPATRIRAEAVQLAAMALRIAEG